MARANHFGLHHDKGYVIFFGQNSYFINMKFSVIKKKIQHVVVMCVCAWSESPWSSDIIVTDFGVTCHQNVSNPDVNSEFYFSCEEAILVANRR